MLSAKEVLRRGLENEPEPVEELPPWAEDILEELAAEAAAQEVVEEFDSPF